MKHFLLCVGLLACCSVHLAAQDSVMVPLRPPVKKFYPRAKVTGLNMSPLLTHLIPFNRASPKQSGPVQVRFRNYRNGNTAFRIGLGANIDTDGDFSDGTSFVNIQIGLEKRKNISERWAYYSSFDVIGMAGSFNAQGSGTEGQNGGVGVGAGMGVEYAIAPRITLSTEAQFVFLIGEAPLISIIPPVGLFLNYYIR